MAKEKYFDESYIKISKFMKTMVTKETLKIFMEKNPSLITYVPKEKVRVAVQRYEEYMKGHPIGSKILKQEKEDLKKATHRKGRL